MIAALRRLRRDKAVRLTTVVLLVGALAASAAPSSVADEVPAYPGSLPDTTSAADATGRGEFDGLKLHVNQTADLTTQAVSVSWSWPGKSTVLGSYPYGGSNKYQFDYLQIMQCWGPAVTAGGTPADDANYVAANPGPAREHCVYGGAAQKGIDALAPNGPTRLAERYTATPSTYGDESVYPSTTDPTAGTQPPEVPFTAANGVTVPHQLVRNDKGIGVYGNEFYDRVSTNEAPAGYTFQDGTGGTQFQAQNALDSRGLGCGATAAGGTGLNACWLVVVPRGELDLDGKELNPEQPAMWGSPLASTHWKDRIAIPLDFKPVATACVDADQTFGTLGSNLVKNAMISWQARLCDTAKLTFNYTAGIDRRSRDDLAAGTDAMEFVSQPADPARTTTAITYAPVTLSGVSISFVWDRALTNSRTLASTPGRPLPTIRLNQRLVAKLVTYSYKQANNYRIGGNAQQRVPDPSEYGWLKHNPLWIGSDPEFLELNPELDDRAIGRNNALYSGGDPISTVQAAVDGSDGVAKLWAWINSDPDARKFLAGAADPHGMVVDPAYSTNPDLNTNGEAFDPTTTDKLPNSDPWVGIPALPANQTACPGQPTLGMIDLRPPASDGAAVARNILAVNPLEKWTGGYRCNSQDGPDGYFSSRPLGPVVPGYRNLMGVTDTASSQQYGLTTAALQNAAGKFVQPTTAAVAAAAAHLAPTDVQGVQQPDLATDDPAAYPLSLLAYAGVTTNGLDATTCAAYATLLDYAAGAGQDPGTSIGQLPPGYAPLPAALRAQTSAAARTVAQCAQDPAPAADLAVSADAGSDDDTVQDVPAPADAAPEAAAVAPAASAAPGVSLAAASRTKPDPSAFAYVVPIAVLVGLLSLLVAPLAGVRRRRTTGAAGPAPGS